jgi:hypothetical protein
MEDPLDKLETRKDTIQVAVESGATHVGSIVSIMVGAVREVTREVGDWATDVFEIRDAARRARRGGDRHWGAGAKDPDGDLDRDSGEVDPVSGVDPDSGQHS